ncbi:hypothetical protein DB346_00945 [Verrucomicrobia bacterium LW23]|nr:hypothetical protein DB346_00945 [Verrucomicrobia bacterium LW23]
MLPIFALFAALSLLAQEAPRAGAPTVWHVDSAKGTDSADGRTPGTAFATIQHAVNLAQPGDTVLLLPGIYYENVAITQGGTEAAPLRIKADRVEKNRVTLTGAVRSLRDKRGGWEMVDQALGMYRVPLAHKPTRVLADQVDLLPYPSLDDLEAFRFIADDYPGHKHGYAWDEKTNHLYVRLRADGKYGATDPNNASMAVAPPAGKGSLGRTPAGPGDFLIAVKMEGAAHIILDGITFETPGIAAVQTSAGDLTVRNCWFYGCRSAITSAQLSQPKLLPARVTVEQCYYTHYPAFSDVADTIRDEAARQAAKPESWQRLMHWQRKSGNLPVSRGIGSPYSYESGFIYRMGKDWIVRHNHFYEVFEAFSSGSAALSTGARIYGNRFERICDNAVETEEHAADMHIYGNQIIDVFEPFSWQPRSGIPLPGPIYIYDNIITETPEFTELWAKANFTGGVFKLGVGSDRMWNMKAMANLPRNVVEAPQGFWATHNTMIVPRGRLVTALNPPGRAYRGFVFLNNIVAARSMFSHKGIPPGMVFDYNAVACLRPDPPEQENTYCIATAGPNGKVFATAADLKEIPGATSRLLTLPDASTLTIPEEAPLRSAAGALPFQATPGPQADAR